MPERSRSSCEEWLAASIPSALSLFLGHSALAETTATFERLTTSGGRTTLGGQVSPLDDGSIPVESGVQVLLEGSVEYHISNGVCTFTSSGSYSAASNPNHGMLSYGILDHTVQSGDACNGKNFPYAVVYYTWTDNQSGATQDSFAVQWKTPDGMMGGPYGYTVQLSQNSGIAFNGQDIASTTQTAVVGQQIALTGSPAPSGNQSGGYWQVGGNNTSSGNPIGGYTATPSTGEILPINLSGQATTFYWTLPGTYTVVYQPSQSSSSASAMFVVSAAPVATVQVHEKESAVACNGSNICDLFFIDDGKRTELWMGFGNIDDSMNLGFVATESATSGSGAFEWAQVVMSDKITKVISSSRKYVCNYGPGLDGTFPYPGGSSMNDSPAVALTLPAGVKPPSTLTGVTRSFSAQAYLLWVSSIPNSIPVPIGSVSWGFTETTVPQSGVPNNWATPIIDSHPGQFANDSSTYPAWNGLSKSKERCGFVTQ